MRSPATSTTTSSGTSSVVWTLMTRRSRRTEHHGREQFAELGGGVLGALLLDVGEYPVTTITTTTAMPSCGMPAMKPKAGRHPEHDRKEVRDLGQEPPPAGYGAELGQSVGPTCSSRRVASSELSPEC